jgi:hypothetical protein
MEREGQVRLSRHDLAWLRYVDYLDPSLCEESERLSDLGGVWLRGPIRSRSHYIGLVRSWLIIIFIGATATGAAQALFRGHW